MESLVGLDPCPDPGLGRQNYPGLKSQNAVHELDQVRTECSRTRVFKRSRRQALPYRRPAGGPVLLLPFLLTPLGVASPELLETRLRAGHLIEVPVSGLESDLELLDRGR